MSDNMIGRVTHYYGRISVAVLVLTEPLHLGETVRIVGRATDFQQEVASLQIDHQAVGLVGPGREVALKVDEPVRKGDAIFRVTP